MIECDEAMSVITHSGPEADMLTLVTLIGGCQPTTTLGSYSDVYHKDMLK